MASTNLTYRIALKDHDAVLRGLKSLGKDGQQALQRIEHASKPASKELMVLDRVTHSVRGEMAGLLSSITAALGIGALVSQVVRVNQTFQDLSAGLETATGSAKDAARAMEVLREFARTTPFQLTEVITAFIRLKNLGLDASTESLRAFGNAAAAMPGKTLMDFAEAVADATVGNFERLEEFGVIAESTGKKVAFTFRGATHEVAKSGDAIQTYIRTLAEANFGGAMERRMKTIGGAASNLKDTLDDLFVSIGQAGANDAIISVLSSTTQVIEGTTRNLATFGQVAEGAAVALGSLMVARLSSAAIAVLHARTAAACVGLRMMSQFGTLATAQMVALSAASRAAAIAAGGLNAALSFFGGPIGLAITALAAGVYYLATQQTAAEQAADQHREALSKFNGLIDVSSGKLRTMSDEVRALQKSQLEAAKSAAENAIRQEELYARAGHARIDRFRHELADEFDPNWFGASDEAVRQAEEVYTRARDLQDAFLAGKISAAELYTMMAKLGDLDPRLKGLVQSMEEWAAPLIKTRTNLEEINAALALLDGNASKAQRELLGLEMPKPKVAPATENEADLTKARSQAEAMTRSLRTAEEKRAETLAQVDTLLQQGLITEETAARARERAARDFENAEKRKLRASRDAVDGIKRALQDLSDESSNVARQWEQDIRSMNQSARDAFIDITSGAKSMSDGLSSIFDDLQRRMLGRLYDRSIGGVFDHVLDGLIGPAIGATGVTGGDFVGPPMPGPQANNIDLLSFAGLPRFHTGGVVRGLQPGETPIVALKGERVLTEAQQDNTARTIAGLAAMARPRNSEVKVTIHNHAGQVAKVNAQPVDHGGGNMGLEVIIEEIEGRMTRNVALGQGMAGVFEQRYGLDPAAGARR